MTAVQNITVLYIEDDTEQRKNNMFVLATRYFKIIEADSCEEGLNLYQEHNPDMIITDIVMGEIQMNGMDMVKKIRETDKEIPILILTSFVCETYLRQAVNLNNIYFIDKGKLYTNTDFEKVLESTETFLNKNFSCSIHQLSHNIHYDFLNGHIVRDEQIIPLTNKECKLSNLFLEKKDEIVTFEMMAIEIWETTVDDSIKVSIRSLVRSIRRKLGDNSFIKSESGKGYGIVIQ